MTIQTNIPPAPRFVYAVNAEAAATPLTRALSFFGGILGFNIGTRVREAFTRPSGFSIREYCASTMAFVESSVGPDGNTTIKVIETVSVPGNPKTRELMIIGANLPDNALAVAMARAEAVAVGFNSAYREIQALTNADLATVNQMIEQAIGVQLASMRAAKAQAEEARAQAVEAMPEVS